MTSKRVETCTLDVHIVKRGGLSRLSPFHKYTWQWQAHAVGPKGSYVAAWSDIFKARGSAQLGYTSDYEVAEQARQKVLSIMLGEGWVPLDSRQVGQTFTRQIE